MLDPWLSYFGHPVLPAGFNADAVSGDEFNGAGTNEPVWPVLFDSFEALEALIITEEMLLFFETDCPDLVVPRENDTIVFPREPETLVIRRRA